MRTIVGRTMQWLAAGAVAMLVGTATAQALELDNDQVKCQAAIGKEATKFVAALLKAHQKCRDANLKAPGACAAPDAAPLEAKLRAGIGKKCDLGTARIASLGFPGPCADADPGNGFTLVDLQDCIATSHERAITGACVGGGNAGEACTTAAECPDSGPGAACRSVLALEYDPALAGLVPLSSTLLACQKTLAHEAGKFLVTVLKAVQAHRNATNKGCGNAAKMAATIAKARTKVHAKIRGKCDDAMVTALGACEPDQTIVGGACAGGINLGEPCTVLGDCPDTGPGTACSGAAPCLTDTHEAIAGDAAATTPPDLIDVEYRCATPSTWPTTVEITASGVDADLDIGWKGIAHAQTIPSNGRLTLGVSGCGSTGYPCGDCALSGPIDNAGGPAFANHRCADKTWIACSTDADCVGNGAAGPCAYFFGAPLPLGAGGVPVCVMNQIGGPVTGTLNLDAGTSTAITPLISKVYVSSIQSAPCPRCDGNICTAGSRAGQPCAAQGTTVFFGDVSLDCPPLPGDLNGTLLIDLPISTGEQTATLSAANPSCRQTGYAGQRCFCDTCNNLEAGPCMTNANCPPSGGNPGICGGARCIGGTNAGAPCVAVSACPGGGLCDRPGQPTQPNPCVDESSVPGDGSLCVDTPPLGDDAGTCPEGPVDLVCSSDTYLPCSNDADCGSGQTCGSRPRSCFLDNGMVSGGVSVAGIVDAPCKGTADPTLGALFCVGPVASPSVNITSGLPGLGRLRLPVTSVLRP